VFQAQWARGRHRGTTGVAGLIARPVIAVSTSVGYGVALGGLAALMGMLSGCTPSVTGVNMDAGFGATIAASWINTPPRQGVLRLLTPRAASTQPSADQKSKSTSAANWCSWVRFGSPTRRYVYSACSATLTAVQLPR
jgi:hypothetical protein